MIAHIVLFKPKSGLTTEQIQVFAQQLQATMNGIPSVVRAQIGRRLNIDSGESRYFGDATYEFSAVVEFDNPGGLIEYLRNPLHQELGRLFWEYCESTVLLEVRAVDAKSSELMDLLVKEPN